MSEASDESRDFMVPIFPVTDMSRALDFYSRVLGFDIRWQWGEPVDFACVASDRAELFLCLNGQGQPGTWMYLFTADAEAFHRRISEQAWSDLSELKDEPWGMREFLVTDPDSNVLRIGTALERIADA